MAKKDAEQLSEKETERRATAALKRALETPPTHHKRLPLVDCFPPSAQKSVKRKAKQSKPDS